MKGQSNPLPLQAPQQQILEESRPDRVALRWARPDALRSFLADPGTSRALHHETVSARELQALVGKAAQGFAGLTIRSGDRVVVCIPLSLQLHVSVLALQRIGAIPVLVDPASRRLSLDECARAVRPKAMISFEKVFVFSAALPGFSRLSARISVGPVSRSYSARLEELMNGQAIASPIESDPDQVALITFRTTASGTLEPEYHTHHSLAALYQALDSRVPNRENEIDLASSSGLSLYNLASGISTIIPAFHLDSPHQHDAKVLLAQLHACGVTCATLTPSMLHRLVEYCRECGIRSILSSHGTSQLNRILVSGSPIHETDLTEMRRITPQTEIKVLFESSERDNPVFQLFRRVS